MSQCSLSARARARTRTLGACFVIVALLALGSPSNVHATITVSSLADSGAGSLRAAIAAAASGETIDFSVTGVITLTSGELLLNKNLTITGPGARDLTISGNLASRIFNVAAAKIVQISGLTLTDGRHIDSGGGIINNGTLSLIGVTVRDSGECGIHNAAGVLSLRDCTVTGNFATLLNGDGGGIMNRGGTLTVTNSTISNNTSATGYGGGGILNFSFPGVATATIINSTIADNTNTWGGGRGSALADAFSPPGSVTLKNTILASTAPGTTCYPATLVPNSLGHNIATDASCNLTGTGDLSSTDPLIEPLQDNGGDTDTHALAVDPLSPAIDYVPDADCTDLLNPLTADQRGAARPKDGDGDDDERCDVGAYEVPSLPGNCPYVPSNTCATAASSSVSFKANTDPSKNAFSWKWSKGNGAIMQSGFGDPVGGSSRVRVCVYDDRSGAPTFVTALAVDAGGICGDKPCWKAVSDKGWSYGNKSGNANAVTKVSFKGGDPSKPQAQVKARGSALPLPATFSPTEFFDQDTTVTVQLHTSGPVGCLTSSFDQASTKKNTGSQFKAKTQ